MEDDLDFLAVDSEGELQPFFMRVLLQGSEIGSRTLHKEEAHGLEGKPFKNTSRWKSMTQLDKASEIVWTECMDLKKGESALILCDEPLRAVGYSLFEKAVELEGNAFFLEMIPLTIHGEEPASLVAEAMKSVDVLVVPASTSLSHTEARRQASARGVRIATMPGITEDIMRRAISADYEKIKERSLKIVDLLSSADAAVITTEKGTDLILPLKGRKALPDYGIYHNEGDFGNLPAGEAYIAPLEGVSEGVLVVDGAIAGIGKLDTPVTITIRNGLAEKIENCPQLKQALTNHGDPGRSVAELGVGTNDQARVVGNVLEDEKAMNTVHVAFGNNISFGGTVNVPVHLDCIIMDPTLAVDDEIVLENGKWLI